MFYNSVKNITRKENIEVYAHELSILGELESLSENSSIDLYYGDESRVSIESCIPYGWQFADKGVVN